MAGRPPKEALDYSVWAVDIFDNDTKIDRLLDAQGAAGFLVYFYLCQKAYSSKGYFYSWSYDDAATTARKIGGGVGSETIKQIVGLCLQIGLFDKRLFDRDGILTSRGIQKRFWFVAKSRKCNEVNPDYWLLENEDTADRPINCTPNLNYEGSKSNYAAPKFNYETQKESKVKESKGKESKVKESSSAGRFAALAFDTENYGDDEARQLRKNLSDIESAAESIGIPMHTRQIQKLELLHADYGYEWVTEAIDRTGRAPKDKISIRYIEGILRNWKARGGIDDDRGGANGTDQRIADGGNDSGSNGYEQFGRHVVKL